MPFAISARFERLETCSVATIGECREEWGVSWLDSKSGSETRTPESTTLGIETGGVQESGIVSLIRVS